MAQNSCVLRGYPLSPAQNPSKHWKHSNCKQNERNRSHAVLTLQLTPNCKGNTQQKNRSIAAGGVTKKNKAFVMLPSSGVISVAGFFLLFPLDFRDREIWIRSFLLLRFSRFREETEPTNTHTTRQRLPALVDSPKILILLRGKAWA